MADDCENGTTLAIRISYRDAIQLAILVRHLHPVQMHRHSQHRMAVVERTAVKML